VTPWLELDGVTVFHGDCRDVMRDLPDNSVDAVVTDPPYELGFMGKRWDDSGVAYDPFVWLEVIRVLKPGGHLLAFGGTRTWHRLAVAIEDAGFEVRDSMAWMYGSGFPKSLDVSKAIDKNNGEVGRLLKFTAWMRMTGLTASDLNKATGTFMGSHYLTNKSQPAIPTPELWQIIRPLCGDIPAWVDELVQRIAAEREVVGSKTSGIANKDEGQRYTIGASKSVQVDITAPATPAAEQWQGWGTALKPAHEPIVVARKPLIGTVAENVLTHGTGALNIDGCRVSEMKRWPANVALDESQAAQLDAQVSRFFYVAKASKKERPNVDGIAHPTVKPMALMRYLVRLVTPPGGTVLEPFAGSGTTIEACVIEGFNCIAIEREADYLPLIEARLNRPIQGAL
jgi:predicted methyltransferase